MNKIISNLDIQYLFNASRYVKRIIGEDIEKQTLFLNKVHNSICRSEMESFLNQQLESYQGGYSEDFIKLILRQLRKDIMCRLIARDIFKLGNLDEVIRVMTDLAEVTCSFALNYLQKELIKNLGTPIGEYSKKPQPFLIVGMGKLGGGELNVSSDIDLIYIYPEEGETENPNNPKKTLSNFEFFTRLARKLTNVLSDITGDGFVFRVDTRLRPDGDSGPLVNTFSMLENYLQSQGREWERYAWIKGRVINRNEENQMYCDQLKNIVRPFVFRKYMDYNAYQSLRELHQQILAENQRKDRKNNVKLGSGGIREIEFIAQVFQLIKGGRELLLQIRPTRDVLEQSAKLKLIQPDVKNNLIQYYNFLRDVEHRIQYFEDKQTQDLPINEADQLSLAKTMGFDSYIVFLDYLENLRKYVSQAFEQILGAPQQDQSSHPLQPIWFEILEEKESLELLQQQGYSESDSKEILYEIKTLKQSSKYKFFSESSCKKIDNLMPPILSLCTKFEDKLLVFKKFIRLIEAIGRRESYLALLQEYPQALNRVAKVFHGSPWASDYLIKHPILLDELIDTASLYELSNWKTNRQILSRKLKLCKNDVEAEMDILRQFKNSEQLKLITQDIEGLLTVETVSDHLSDLADLILDQSLNYVWKNYPKKHCESPNFAIIAYGKLGGKELGYRSDLDLVFIYDDEHEDAPEIYARFAQRLNTWLSSMTASGLLYEIDLRLRPNGASGLLVSSVHAFENYQQKNAWTWEHQALSRARYVTGCEKIKAQFEKIREDILSRSRNLETLKTEIYDMRIKMIEGHKNPTQLFDLKHDRGGIVDIEFIVQYLILAYSQQVKALMQNAGNIALLGIAGDHQLIDTQLAEKAQTAYRTYRKISHALNMKGNDKARIDLKNYSELNQMVTSVQLLWTKLFGKL